MYKILLMISERDNNKSIYSYYTEPNTTDPTKNDIWSTEILTELYDKIEVLLNDYTIEQIHPIQTVSYKVEVDTLTPAP